MTVLVTGATGTVGREVVRALLELGAAVRALSRDPETAALPAEVEVVRGDLTDLETVGAALDGVEAVHLITFSAPRGSGGGEALAEADAIVALLREHDVRRATVLQNGHPGPLEKAISASDLSWTILQPVEFMANAREWTASVRDEGRVVEPYVDRLSSMVHEADIGDVAAVALTTAGHGGRAYSITGPELLTVGDKVATLSAATGREIELVALTSEQAVERWRQQGYDAEMIGFFQWVFGDPPEVGRTVADTVPRVTGHPARTFAEWATTHAAEFGG